MGEDADVADRFTPPRGRLLLHAVGCLAAAAVCYVPTRSVLTGLVWFGWIAVAALVAAAVVLTARAVRPGPSVVVGREGVTERTALSPAVLVRWDEITVVRKKEIGRGRGAERVLEIVLRDPAAYRARPRGWRRRVVEFVRRLWKLPEVIVPGSMVSVPLARVAEAVQRWRPDLEVLQGPPPAPPKWRPGRRTPSSRRHPELPRW